MNRVLQNVISTCMALTTVLTASVTYARTFDGTVVGVTDKCSLIVRDAVTQDISQVTLAYISIPWGEHPFAGVAKQVLTAQLTGHEVHVEPIESSSKDMPVNWIYGLVTVKGHPFNSDFVRHGYAFPEDHKLVPKQINLAYLDARKRKAGIWSKGLDVSSPEEFQRLSAANKVIHEALQSANESNATSVAMQKMVIMNTTAKLYAPTKCKAWSHYPVAKRKVELSASKATSMGYALDPSCQSS